MHAVLYEINFNTMAIEHQELEFSESKQKLEFSERTPNLVVLFLIQKKNVDDSAFVSVVLIK